MKQGQTFVGKVESLGFGGEGVLRVEDFVIFIKGALPGQEGEFVLSKKKKNHGEGKILKITKKSSDEISPKCKHFGKCGGCVWQNLSYEKQLLYKEQQVKECLKHIGKIEDFEIEKILPSPSEFAYRNKVELSFGYEKMEVTRDENGNKIFNDTGESLGFHKKGKWQEIVDVTHCDLISENANKVFLFLKKWALSKKDKKVFNPYPSKGFWRHLLLRENFKGEILLNLILGEEIEKSFFDEISSELKKLGVKSFFRTLNQKLNDDWSDLETFLVFGEEVIYEEICGLKFAISPKSFFQTNSHGAENLYGVVKNYASGISKNLILDLYCGTGTIGQILAKETGAQVIGIEYNESATQDANKNAKLNGLKNAKFLCGKVEDLLPGILKENGKIDLVVIDPPRVGMHKKATETLLTFLPKEIVYVSCNPATFARDFTLLSENYELEKLRPVDMFPQTSHIELVAKLRLKSV